MSADSIRFVLLPNWRLGLTVLVVVGVLILVTLMLRARSMQASETQTAEIIHFGLYPSPDGTGDTPVIILRYRNGTTAELRPTMQEMARCRVGDRITFTTGPGGTTVHRCAPSTP